jgi:hypothetical protein
MRAANPYRRHQRKPCPQLPPFPQRLAVEESKAYGWDSLAVADPGWRAALSDGAFKVTDLYTALCIYLAALTAFLGWWARFPR